VRSETRFTVIVTDHIFPSLDPERTTLAAVGAEVRTVPEANPERLRDAVPNADALLVCYAQISQDVIERAQRCRVIARYGIGVDNIDVAAATRQGIVVTNVPDYCVEEVSDHTLAFLLACARKVPRMDRETRHRWDNRAAVPIHRLRGQVLGLIGFGKIPRALAARVVPLGMRIITFDPYVGAEAMRAHGAAPGDLATVLAESDFVSLHAPLTPETTGLIDEAALRAMKPTAYLINTARGALVDQTALARALREGWIAGAALDVLPDEPPAADNPLLTLSNVILTPHIAFYSEESQRELQQKAAEEVARVLTGRPPRYPVNKILPVSPSGR